MRVGEREKERKKEKEKEKRRDRRRKKISGLFRFSKPDFILPSDFRNEISFLRILNIDLIF